MRSMIIKNRLEIITLSFYRETITYMSNIIENAFVECFWLTASEAVKLFVPVIAIVILFKILHYFLLGGK